MMDRLADGSGLLLSETRTKGWRTDLSFHHLVANTMPLHYQGGTYLPSLTRLGIRVVFGREVFHHYE
jgi:hypothetical protein